MHFLHLRKKKKRTNYYKNKCFKDTVVVLDVCIWLWMYLILVEDLQNRAETKSFDPLVDSKKTVDSSFQSCFKLKCFYIS